MTKSTLPIVLFFALSGLLIFQGCSKNPFGAVRVTGTVTLDGVPIEGVNIAFLPPQSSTDVRQAYGKTDAQGRFVLTIPGAEFGSGAVPGEYVPTFVKIKDPLEGKTDGMEGLSTEDYDRELARRFPRGVPTAENLLPEKYDNRRETPITPVTVERRGKNDFTFELTTN
jgi:hypothetical protein